MILNEFSRFFRASRRTMLGFGPRSQFFFSVYFSGCPRSIFNREWVFSFHLFIVYRFLYMRSRQFWRSWARCNRFVEFMKIFGRRTIGRKRKRRQTNKKCLMILFFSFISIFLSFFFLILQRRTRPSRINNNRTHNIYHEERTVPRRVLSVWLPQKKTVVSMFSSFLLISYHFFFFRFVFYHFGSIILTRDYVRHASFINRHNYPIN